MHGLKLKPRLGMAAEMVRAGSRVADIGTDHAYLPAFLLLNSRVESAVAADLRKGPLENAEATVRSCSLEDKVSLRLSDGLASVRPDEADDIVIAGMGGILIAEILQKAPWVKDSAKRLILQPQSHDEDVRRFLFENGFDIIKEDACFEDGKAYICMCAQYTGRVCPHSEAEIMLGGFAGRTDEASRAFTEKKLKRIRVRANALSQRNENPEELEFLFKILDEVTA